MKAVLDISVALKWVLVEKDSAKAQSFRAEFIRGIHDLLAPDIFPIECSNGLVKKKDPQARGGRGANCGYPFHPSRFFSCPPLLARAIEIASANRCSVYDCLYVALAEREGCEFITSDGPVLKNLRVDFPFVIDLASLP